METKIIQIIRVIFFIISILSFFMFIVIGGLNSKEITKETKCYDGHGNEIIGQKCIEKENKINEKYNGILSFLIILFVLSMFTNAIIVLIEDGN